MMAHESCVIGVTRLSAELGKTQLHLYVYIALTQANLYKILKIFLLRAYMIIRSDFWTRQLF